MRSSKPEMTKKFCLFRGQKLPAGDVFAKLLFSRQFYWLAGRKVLNNELFKPYIRYFYYIYEILLDISLIMYYTKGCVQKELRSTRNLNPTKI
jgi:hypothetical protein